MTSRRHSIARKRSGNDGPFNRVNTGSTDQRLRGFQQGKTWKDAAEFLVHAAELAKVVPELRAQRVNALSVVATARENSTTKPGVANALLLAGTNSSSVKGNNRCQPSPQTVEATGWTSRHSMVVRWRAWDVTLKWRVVVRAEQLRDEKLSVERLKLKRTLHETTANVSSQNGRNRDAELRKFLRKH